MPFFKVMEKVFARVLDCNIQAFQSWNQGVYRKSLRSIDVGRQPGCVQNCILDIPTHTLPELWMSAIHLHFSIFAYLISKPENIVPQKKLRNLFAIYGCWPPDYPDVGF
jgi:hypothetical protein